MITRLLTTAIAGLILSGLSLGICADPLILSPTANTLTTGQYRAEAAWRSNNSRDRLFRLGAGFQQYEVNVLRLEKHDSRADNIVGVQWSFLPETSFNPAVAFGISDAGNQSDDGTGIYGVITRHLPIGRSSVFIKDFAATVGLGLFGIRGPFAGFEARLPYKFFVQGEYDSRNLNGAIGWQPLKQFRVKAYTIDKDYYLGAELVPVFF
ncbi:MAG: hypothetical protein ACOX3G_02500 [Armatimonadota bacterium]